MKKSSGKELQSRREFFKKAAKGALPILGAIALSQMPFVSNAGNASTGCSSDGCSYTCKTSCQSECRGYCRYGCKSTCTGTCSGSSKR